jgi:ATP-dependent Lon protease
MERTNAMRDFAMKDFVFERGADPRPTPAFERVAQRAALHAQELGQPAVTGANTLLALFSETRSPAARLLGEQGVSRERTAGFIARSVGKGAG